MGSFPIAFFVPAVYPPFAALASVRCQPAFLSVRAGPTMDVAARSSAAGHFFLSADARVCCRFIRGRAGVCFCARQGARSVIWLFQISDE